MVLIESIDRRAEWVDLLAGWHFAQWQQFYPGWSIEAARRELASHGDPNRIPLTLVAVEEGEGEAVGSVSLLEKDLDGWDHLTPWLASLFVRSDRRGRGIGKFLVRQAVEQARRMGVAELYLFTPGQVEFYAALGWRVFARTTAAGEPVCILSRAL